MLTGELEIQVEILNRWRYAAITDGCWMTHRDTRYHIKGKELLRFLAAQFNILIQILPLLRRRRSVHVVRLTDCSNADD